MKEQNIILGAIFASALAFVIYASTIGFGDAIKEPRYRVEAELEQYLTDFVAMAELRGIDLTYIYESDIVIVWEHAINKNSTNVATAFKRNKDGIAIVVNKKRFNDNRTIEGKRYVMYHEFGHDILNFAHQDEGMMRSTAYSGFFKVGKFPQARREAYLYKSLSDMFNLID